MRKYLYLIIIGNLFSAILFAQVDSNKIVTTKIYNCKVLKKGFYKSYDEYLNNAPSIIKEFTNTLIYKSDKDSTTVGGQFELLDSALQADTVYPEEKYKMPNIWGYCDGKDVFVKEGSFLTSKRYWKLQCLGKNPYIYQGFKNLSPFGSAIAGDLLTAPFLNPDHYEIMYINGKGKVEAPTPAKIKRLISSDLDLLKRYKAESIIFYKTMEKYLRLFNERNRN